MHRIRRPPASIGIPWWLIEFDAPFAELGFPVVVDAPKKHTVLVGEQCGLTPCPAPAALLPVRLRLHLDGNLFDLAKASAMAEHRMRSRVRLPIKNKLEPTKRAYEIIDLHAHMHNMMGECDGGASGTQIPHSIVA